MAWDLFGTIGELATSVVGSIGDAFSGVGNLFGGGDYTELAPFSSMSGPEIFGGAMADAGELDIGAGGELLGLVGYGNDPSALSGLLQSGGSLADFGSALGVSASDIYNMGTGTLDAAGNILGWADEGSAIANWMGNQSSQVQNAIQGTPQGQAAEAAKKLAGKGGTGAGSQQSTTGGGTGAGTKKPSSVVPDTIQKLANLATATGGMMPTPSLRPGKTARATDYMPKLAARNVTAAKYIQHYTMVAGTKPASFKFA